MALRWILLVLLLAVLAAVPAFAASSQTFLAIVFAKSLAVLGLLLLLQAGQVSFGHGMFFATGAYTVAFLGRSMGGGDIALLLAASAVSSVVLGLLVGLFVVRYRYIFFGMLNLAFSMVLYSILEKFFHLTGGSDGLRIRRPSAFGFAFDRAQFDTLIYYLTLVLAFGAAYLVWRYLRSPLGQALKAIKSNETRLEYIGLSARFVMLVGYVISALLCGIGGACLGIIQGIATPEYSYWTRSAEFVFIAILGGVGHVAGALTGTFVYEAVRTYAAAFVADSWQMILGFVLLAIILKAPTGIVGLVQAIAGRRKAQADAALTVETAR
ncbi:branched-chain amino acid ABC transporter permease [Xanthobacter oligotrophicus]|uniref:branched-chain amino acid ABC transporter permease n=1 Tax=Xanthobacter oligotrophicus TaxID=2607286 RepID=UPI0011F3A7B7|nr:branched-chain amino acid ABC transporter permease [Xanthobacter oligotrophicus]MCG5236571.1 branched-chain amino acid ABC transporter permease [Xanthobacter oligotrophicus]